MPRSVLVSATGGRAAARGATLGAEERENKNLRQAAHSRGAEGLQKAAVLIKLVAVVLLPARLALPRRDDRDEGEARLSRERRRAAGETKGIFHYIYFLWRSPGHAQISYSGAAVGRG